MLDEGKQGDTLHGAIKEVLDYRQWFSFTPVLQPRGRTRSGTDQQRLLQVQRGAKRRWQCTSRCCLRRSPDTPRRVTTPPTSVSLDEAFAGVDENNVRDMFDLLGKLGFDYIMNSASLWGDYDTVSSLSICELVRPRNASFVTCVRYRWDGQTRQFDGISPGAWRRQVKSAKEARAVAGHGSERSRPMIKSGGRSNG